MTIDIGVHSNLLGLYRYMAKLARRDCQPNAHPDILTNSPDRCCYLVHWVGTSL